MRLYGKNPVFERLRSNPQSIRKIFLQQGFNEAAYVYKKAKQYEIPVISILKSKLMKIARNINSQGIWAELDEFIYRPYPEMLEEAGRQGRSILFLDSLNDPQNLGGIIRSLACLGEFALVLPTHDCVAVTEAVLRVACGGENYVPVARAANLARALDQAKEQNFLIAGAVVKGPLSLREARFTFPLGIVIGSEQKGIRDIVKRHLDLEFSIPMAFDSLSLNVAHAASIICYEITQQKESPRTH